ncbi:hypothetical protein [Maribacter dokdonensis]|uniref:hypothetical protein n=1 Tax=Maribacter dokdonensis TaxID=320912 RepID=UPI001B279BB6|nr:hypothetical protein [Maribacter dokdonensis]MBU2902830.1 hypothetical protein [Maribacter dokdonensis]CAG2533868.1 hypothetical protein MAR621_03734 [Maribacter dokdonensis]|tara:strand:+ start:12205 stop:13143 length:939 start_codon:yes stop_codon:yes gene_type:complete
MKDNYIPLKVNREFGGIISAYFDFFKQNIKSFTNVFLSYNGVFLIGLLITSYLLVSGFIGMIAHESGQSPFSDNLAAEEEYYVYLGIGGFLFFVIFLGVAFLNYSLSTSYMIKYEETKDSNVDKKEVWQYAKSQFGNILLFVLLLIPIYLVYFIVAIILAIIPLLGFFAQYIVQFFLTAWIGVSFFDMLQNKKSVTDALGEGWKLVTGSFWKSIGVNFILGLLLGLLLMIALIIPGIIIGVYTFHVVENDVDYTNSIVSTIVYTLGLSIFLIIAVYGQCLSQFINGILYYALHEKTYNENTRARIEQIGQND